MNAKIVVSVIYHQGGTSHTHLRVFGPGDPVVPLSTADAICLTLAEMEAAGVDIDAPTGWAIVAKRGMGADALLPPVRHETAPSGPAMRFAIDSGGALTLDLADGQSDPLRLTAAETLALGDFLHHCEGLWRP